MRNEKSISSAHLNRKPYNWLVYDLLDAHLEKNKHLIQGDLYDMGCGDKPYKNWFLQHADRYVGVDWGDSLHDHHADVLADLNKPIPLNSGVADTVVSISVMEHLSEPQTMLAEAFRILKPGGTLLLQVPFMWWVHEAPYDYYRFTNFGLNHLLEKTGFVNISIAPMSGFWSMWVLKFNYHSIRFIYGVWPIRKLKALLIHTIWKIDQRVAPWLDKKLPCPEETLGYFVTASKP